MIVHIITSKGMDVPHWIELLLAHMTKILAAQPILDKRVTELTKECDSLKSDGIHPSMKVILVGDNPSSLSYIRNKKKLCHAVGAKFDLIHLDESISEQELISEIEKLNNDNETHGFFVQFPVPAHLKEVPITTLINPNKDIDGFGPNSVASLYANTNSNFIPCTPKGIISLLAFYNIELEGKKVAVIGRSTIVGRPLSLLLLNKNATVVMCHSKTKELQEITKSSDIIICAIGKKNFIDSNFITPEKKQVLIDVGINFENGKLSGDCDFEQIKDQVQAITPVPGGVGPLTVLSLIENLFIAAKQKA